MSCHRRSHPFTDVLTAGDLKSTQGDLPAADADLTQAVELFTEAGYANGIGRAYVRLAGVVRRMGDDKRAERLYRDVIGLLKPLEDRGTLCEAQRGLAEVMLDRGNLDEAEKYALLARETVGAQDVTSLSTTAFALGRVRAAQGRDDEAEALLREAIERVDHTDCFKYWSEPVTTLEPTRYVAWEKRALRSLIDRNPSMGIVLNAELTEDMADQAIKMALSCSATSERSKAGCERNE